MEFTLINTKIMKCTCYLWRSEMYTDVLCAATLYICSVIFVENIYISMCLYGCVLFCEAALQY